MARTVIPDQSGLPTMLRQTLRVVHHPRTPSHISKDQHCRAPLSRRLRIHLGDEQHRADEEWEDYGEEDGEDEGSRDGVVGLVRLEDGGHDEGGSEGRGRGGRGRSGSEQLELEAPELELLELEQLELEEWPLVGAIRVMVQPKALCSQCCKPMLKSVQIEEPAYETASPVPRLDSRQSTASHVAKWRRIVSFCITPIYSPSMTTTSNRSRTGSLISPLTTSRGLSASNA